MIFYFTGTGNSLYAAKELDEMIISIPQIIEKERLEFSADSIGIVCPIYGHEMPAMVKDFIRRASLKTDYFFVVLTYGAHHGGAAESVPGYVPQAAFIWKTNRPFTIQKDARPAAPVSTPAPRWLWALAFPGRKRILPQDTAMSM